MHRILDLCSGIGCFHMASKLAGMKCIGFAEIDDKLALRYQKAYSIPDELSFKSVSEIISKAKGSGELLKKLQDVAIMAGFPCTPWSKSGKQTGKNHAKGMVFWEILELMKSINSPFFVFENVPNLNSEKHEDTYKEMLDSLNENYHTDDKIISNRDVNLPTNRRRLFIVGVRKDLSSQKLVDSILDVVSKKEKQSLDNFLKSDKQGYSLTDSQKKALELWDPFLEWIIDSGSIKQIAKPLWATEALFCNSYDIQKLQTAVEKKANDSKITKSNLLKCIRLEQSSDSRLTVDELIVKYLPPYYRKIARGEPRSSDYKERAKFAEKSRNYMLEIQSWVETKHGITAWASWVNELQNQEMSFQKLEWNLGKENPRKSKAKSALKRVQNRLKDTLVQFRSSGIRISKKTEFPTLVAIGQVAFTGSPMRQPHWTTLAKLQSINDQELLKSGLFGDDKEAIKRLGNAANVEIIRQISENIKQSITRFSK